MSIILKELSPIFNFKEVVCWTDSTIVLHWISNNKKIYHPFIQKRAQKI